MIQYLLGELPEQERHVLEEMCLADYSLFERMRAVERDLIDNYLRGRLPEDKNEKFTRYYLASPRRSREVAIASSFLKFVSDASTESQAERVSSRDESLSLKQSLLGHFRGWIPVWSLAAAGAVILLVGTWLVVETVRNRQQLAQERAALERREQELRAKVAEQQGQKEVPVRERERTEQPQTKSGVVPLFLTASLGRGGSRGIGLSRESPIRLVLAHDAKIVQLRLDPGNNEYPAYRVDLETEPGVKVYSQSRIKAGAARNGKAVTCNIPASRLASQVYRLKLGGIVAPSKPNEFDEIVEYFIKVERK